MPNLLFQAITIVFNLVIAIFVIYYLTSLRAKENEVSKKQKQIEENYKSALTTGQTQEHQILENAMNQSSQIMQVATHQANQIIAGTQYITQASKTSLEQALQRMIIDVQNTGSNSKMTLEQALQKIVVDVHREAFDTGREFATNYSASLKQIANLSLAGFQTVASELELDLQKQIKDFRQTLLTNLEKELEVYKQSRMRKVDQASVTIVQKFAQEMLNKSLSLDDHEKLLIDSLEKAKQEGLFD